MRRIARCRLEGADGAIAGSTTLGHRSAQRPGVQLRAPRTTGSNATTLQARGPRRRHRTMLGAKARAQTDRSFQSARPRSSAAMPLLGGDNAEWGRLIGPGPATGVARDLLARSMRQRDRPPDAPRFP